ncbi:GspE/PulE family protein [Escherichia coli]
MVPVAQETTANTVRLPYSFSRRFSLVAWCEASLEILHVHPLSLSVLQELQRGLNAPFTLRQIDDAEFEQRLNAVWQRDSSETRQLMEDLGSAEDFFTLAEELPETEDLLESDDDAPIIKLINAMLAEAIKEGASDIHIETFEKSLVIRFRVDGTLHEMLRPGRKLASLLVSRIKVMARLDIAEKRVPVMAQRLVRTLCPDCRQPAPATDEEKRLLGITDARTVTLYHPQGCPACNHKGFRGRTAIHELLVVDATLRDLIHRQAGELELERYVRQHSAGIRSNGIEKVLAGETSLDEVLRVTMEA